MNLPSGLAASSMIATASRIANTMIGMCSAMPTAVITESSENTMSITAICAITTQNTDELLVVRGSSSSPPEISSRISIVPFTSRNTPPRISTRSRIEMPMPNSENRSVCIRARNASITSSRIRVMQATAMPILRATGRRCSGSRPTAIEMNTRLSMPSTISNALSVTRVSHASGEARKLRSIRFSVSSRQYRLVKASAARGSGPTPATRSSSPRTRRPSPCPWRARPVRGTPGRSARSPPRSPS